MRVLKCSERKIKGNEARHSKEGYYWIWFRLSELRANSNRKIAEDWNEWVGRVVIRSNKQKANRI